jgi:hypothetical protein
MSTAKSAPKNNKKISEEMTMAFKKITDFVDSLCDAVYIDKQKKNHELYLYNVLLSKTMWKHKQSITRHIKVFHEFIIRNRDAIYSRDINLLVSKISYSNAAFIDLPGIMKDPDTSSDIIESIWNHLLAIESTIDPTSKARELLRQLSSGSSSSNEENFLAGFINKLEGSIDKQKAATDPIGAINPGIVSDLLGSIQSESSNGSLDMNKLVGTVQNMLGCIAPLLQNQGPGNLSGHNNNNQGLDLGAMIGMVSTLMPGLTGNNASALSSSSSGSTISGLNVENVQKRLEATLDEELKKSKEQK